MAYIGRGLVQGTYIKLDDLQSSFNGTTSTFSLTSGGSAFSPGSASALLVSLGGIIQEPIESYTVIDDQITFSSPPTSDRVRCSVRPDLLGGVVFVWGKMDSLGWEAFLLSCLPNTQNQLSD